MIPKLIHPVDCEIVQLKEKASIEYDEDFDEPVDPNDDNLYDTENKILISGQLKVFTWDELQAKLSGYSENAKGYLLVKKADGTAINKTDKIITIAGDTIEYYIIEKRPASVYHKKYYFYKLIFTTRDRGMNL